MAKQGRPFTYQSDDEKPVMVSARLPRLLTELVTRYAKERQQSLSTLIKEGLEWRIGDGDPRGSGMYLAQPGGLSEKMYDSNTTTAPTAHEAEALQEVRSLLARQWEQIQALAQTVERQAATGNHRVYDSNTVNEASTDTAPVHNSNTVIQKAQHTAIPTTKPDPATVAATHHLGTLCSRGHDHEGTGHSLRNADNQCLKCNAERKAAKDARKKQAKTASTRAT